MRRRCDAKAIGALGHEILLAAYRVVATAQPYTDPGPKALSGLTTQRLTRQAVKRLQGLGYQVTSILAGSMAPIIATALLQQYKSWLPVAFYLVIACAITVVAVVTLKETRGISLREVDAEDARKHGLEPARVSG